MRMNFQEAFSSLLSNGSENAEIAIFNGTVAKSSRKNFLILIFSLLAFCIIVITWGEVEVQ